MLPMNSMVPKEQPCAILDIKDCFFSIPLHEKDEERFAFSVVFPNSQRPNMCFQWKVLPQEMINLPTICQITVDRALAPAQQDNPNATIIQYMDNILGAAPSENQIIIVPKVLHHPEEKMCYYWGEDNGKRHKREILTAVMIAALLGLGVAGTQQLQLLHFCLFLATYLAALLGNSLIITTIAWHHHLHTPMYFFLINLALLDLGTISTTVPKSVADSLRHSRAISYAGCAAQVFFVLFFIPAEYFLLTIMAYDRYVAICRPLHYGTLLGSRACAYMAAAAWAYGFLHALLHTANTFSLPLCQGNAVHQFFCEIPQILKLSCSTAYLREVWAIVVGISLALACFVFIVVSYVQIFRAVLRMSSQQGCHKAFATCLPHLAVVSLFLSTGFFAYLNSPFMSSPSWNLVVSVLYSLVPPAVKPLIYSLRNQELKAALSKLLTGCFQKQ
ncbi:olfactory receptor 14A16-like [Pogoniulus pusillus]|uniref:olfactory receptor 14A16-like n=1 Tax=Pogoniulus pusillus TaxID=488313 RepID=UPI0030B94B30